MYYNIPVKRQWVSLYIRSLFLFLLTGCEWNCVIQTTERQPTAQRLLNGVIARGRQVYFMRCQIHFLFNTFEAGIYWMWFHRHIQYIKTHNTVFHLQPIFVHTCFVSKWNLLDVTKRIRKRLIQQCYYKLMSHSNPCSNIILGLLSVALKSG